ncbi:MAG: type V CRISPR-associated protein Cas12a/Cpf1, partial [Candidatus Taylorbacteria bacterium]|nr:type V CRISPR-associated protein Cas12a/Cpf1 [Candidatus Taylorbacteria bacterium]
FTNRKRGGEVIAGFDEVHKKITTILSLDTRDQKNREVIKLFFDAGMPIFQMGKYFSLDVHNKRGAEKPVHINAEFYNSYDKYTENFNFAKQFDLFRNYISKKPGDDEDKVKLNFEKGNLLGGWAESPIGNAQFQGYILRKDDTYYLGVTTDPHFLDMTKYSKELTPVDGGEVYEKLEYFQLDWGKNIVGGQVYTSFTKEKLGERLSFQQHKLRFPSPSEHVLFIKDLIKEKYLSRYTFLEDFLKQSFPDPKTMQQAFAKLPHSGMKFVQVLAPRIDAQEGTSVKNKNSLLYLFVITNKDLHNKSTKNVSNAHSLYWSALFSKENLFNLQIKLLGGAEIFLRRGKPHELAVRKDNKGKEVLAHKRYATDKQFLHIPISLNVKAPNPPTSKRFNKKMRTFLAKHPNTHVIGIDRGEKHLLYYSVVGPKGEIVEQGSMNELEIAGKNVNFHTKLVELEKERIKNRQSWAPVRGIKDLRKGYISHVIHKVVELIDKYQAVVVLEDLNMRFKQVRGGIERSVYQQFEKALIDKLGYLVFKKREESVPGGVMLGYQLVAPFDSFEKLGKQTGILFYTQADYTSITDPLTGFRKNVYISNSESVKKLRDEVFGQKISIGWDEKHKSYTFSYDQATFVKDKNSDTVSKKWTVYANILRVKRSKDSGYWQYALVNPNDMLEELFATWEIQNPHEGLWDKIMEADNLSEQKEFDGRKRGFWHSLIFIFNLILQTRNSSSQTYKKDEKGDLIADGEDVDFISSPVTPFFRTGFTWKGEKYPAQFGRFEDYVNGENKEHILSSYNGDANGAYNIARKGLIILERIQDNPDIEEKGLFIKKEEWDKATAKWAEENKKN